MRRLQILMSEDLDDALERCARKERTSKSELIRRFVRQQIRTLPRLEDDPLWKIATAGPLRREPAEPTSEVDRVVYMEEIEDELRGGRSAGSVRSRPGRARRA